MELSRARPTRPSGSPGRRLRRLGMQAGAVVASVAMTVGLTQVSSSGAFTASTHDSANTVSAAANFCTAPGPVLASSAVDTAIYQAGANAGTNYSASTQIGAGASNNANVRTLIKFTLPNRPQGCVLSSATLSLRINSASAAPAPIEVYRAGASWDVTTVTWNNWVVQPTQTVGTPVTTASVGVGGVQTWNVTTLVSGLYAGPDHGFLIKDAGEGSGVSRYNVYESMDVVTTSYRPQLSVTWD